MLRFLSTRIMRIYFIFSFVHLFYSRVYFSLLSIVLDLYYVYIYIYYLISPHCVGCARNDVDIYTDDLTNKAHNNNNNNNNDDDDDNNNTNNNDNNNNNNNNLLLLLLIKKLT